MIIDLTDELNDGVDVELVRTILNIYLYGEKKRPEYFGDHIRSDSDRTESIQIQFDAEDFMTSGPGRFIDPSDFPVVQGFFNGELSQKLIDAGFIIPSFENGLENQTLTLSGQNLIDLGILFDDLTNGSDFVASLQHKSLETSDADYAYRTFLFNTQTFRLPRDIEFNFTAEGVFLSNVSIAPDNVFGDNFDFRTNEGSGTLGTRITQFASDILLEPYFDPYSLGENDSGADVGVALQYTGEGRNFGTYTNDNFQSDLSDPPMIVSGIEGNARFTLAAMNLADELEFFQDDQGRTIVYGTNQDDLLSSVSGLPVPDISDDSVHWVGGDGEDRIFGTEQDDYIEGNNDDDAELNGGRGDDIIIGGEGSDRLVGREGDDLLYGDEEVDDDGNNRIADAPDTNEDDIDTVDYSGTGPFGLSGADAVTLDTTSLSETQIQAGFLLVTDDGQDGEDRLHSIERLILTSEDDEVILTASLEDISLIEIDFGAGIDTLDLSGAEEGLTIDLSSTEDEMIRILGVERIILSDQSDTLTFGTAALTPLEEEEEASEDEMNDIVISAGDMVDTLTLSDADEGTNFYFFGDEGNDEISILAGEGDVFGGDDDDVIEISSPGEFYAFGGEGRDTITASSGSIFGGDGEDILISTSEAGETVELYGINIRDLVDTFDPETDGEITPGSEQILSLFVDDFDLANLPAQENQVHPLSFSDLLIGGAGNDIFHVGNGDYVQDFDIEKDELNVYLSGGLPARLSITLLDISSPAGEDWIEQFDSFSRAIFTEGTNSDNIEVFLNQDGFGINSSEVFIFVETEITSYIDFLDEILNIIAFQDINEMGPDPAPESQITLNTFDHWNGIEGNGEVGIYDADRWYQAMPNYIVRYIDTPEFLFDAVVTPTPLNLIAGTIFDDDLRGTEMNDRLVGGQGSDILSGGDGNDQIEGGLRDDLLRGGSGEDALYGGQGNDFVNAGGGADELFGGIGDDFLIGEDGDDYLSGGLGDDRLRGDLGNDTIYGGQGADFLIGGAGNDLLFAESGDDTILIGSGDDVVDGGIGFDAIRFDNTSSRVELDMGTGTLTLYDAVGDIIGTTSVNNVEAIYATTGDDVLLGNVAPTLLSGRAGDDLIIGGANNDTLLGGAGNDDLSGGAGDDFARGNSGDDMISGGLGDDFLLGDDGADTLSGNEGLDSIRGGDGNDTINGNEDRDRLQGNDGDDIISGGQGDDLIWGGNGADAINGNEGEDDIRGDEGNDIINGNSGNDRLQGNAGDDTFIFEVGTGYDSIVDFNVSGDDIIDLSDFGFSDFTDLTDNIRESGNHVIIELSDIDQLVLLNTDLIDLDASDFLI